MRRFAPLLLILGLAGALRFHGIAHRPLWYDEICSVLIADGRFRFEDLEDGVPTAKPSPTIGPPGDLSCVVEVEGNDHPAAYFLLLREWKALFGDGPGAARSLSAVFSLLSVAAGAALVHAVAGRRAALLGALVLAASAFEVDYAREARPYAMLGFFSLLSTLALVRAEASSGRARVTWWAAYAGAIALGLATGFTFVLVPAAHVLSFLASGRARACASIAWACLFAALLLLPLAGATSKQLFRMGRQVASGLGLAHLGAAEQKGFLAARSHVPGLFAECMGQLLGGLEAAPLAGGVLFALFVALAGIAVRAERRERAGAPLLFVAAIGPLTLLSMDLALGSHSCSTARYAMVSSGALGGLMGIGLARLRARLAVPALVALLACSGSGIRRADAKPGTLADFQGCARAMTARGCDRQDLVVLVLFYTRFSLELNRALPGAPTEMLVEKQFDAPILDRRWRNVFLVFMDDRRRSGEDVRAFIGARLPERERSRFDRLSLVRFSREVP